MHFFVCSQPIAHNNVKFQISKQQKSLKCSPLEEREFALAAWFKQACNSNAFTDGTHLKKALHIAAHLEIAKFQLPTAGSIDLFTEFYQMRTGVLIQKTGIIRDYCKERKVMTPVIYVMLIKHVYFATYNPAKPPRFVDIFATVVLNLNSRLLCFLHAIQMVVINYHLL
jgi:hypothetical protein